MDTGPVKPELKIRDANIPAHLDIEKEIATRKNGQVTMTIRVNAGNIMDLVVVEYVDAQHYLRIGALALEEHRTTHNNRK